MTPGRNDIKQHQTNEKYHSIRCFAITIRWIWFVPS